MTSMYYDIADFRAVADETTLATTAIQKAIGTALKVGSETSGEFRNITMKNCTIEDAACGIGLWMRDGGMIDGVNISNINMNISRGGTTVFCWLGRREDDTPLGVMRNVIINADGCMFLQGHAEQFSYQNERQRCELPD